MSWWDRLFGARDRLGWWTVPVFVMVGLTGSVLAGTLATVYYGQRVDALADETRAGRDELRGAVDDVRKAGQEALDAIETEVDAVRDSLSREYPLEDVAAHGVVGIRSFLGREPATPAPTPSPGASPPPPTGPRFRGERLGNGFAVALEDGVAFFATTFSVVADPDAPGGVAEAVEVLLPSGAVAGQVHSWDARRDLALVRAEAGAPEILPWRPAAEELALGERLFLAGVTPSLAPIQVAGQAAYADVAAMLTDLPAIGFLSGAPIVDGHGHVVAVYSTSYQPFGTSGGPDQASIPAPLLCEQMLRDCASLEAAPEDRTEAPTEE